MKKYTIITILIIITIICASIGIIIYNQNKINNNKNTEIENNTIGTIILDDENLIYDLNEKVYQLFNFFESNNTNFNDKSYYAGWMSFNDKILSSDYNDKDKLYHTLVKTYFKVVDTTKEHSNSLNLKDVEEMSIKLYNKTFTNTDFIAADYCPGFEYDKDNQIYVVFESCGGAGPIGQHYYINNYTIENNDIYGEIYIGTQMCDENFKCYLAKEYVNDYKMSENTNIYKELSEDEFVNSTLINSENYTNFEKYIIKFTKNENDDYYFVYLKKA